ncbi:MAG TPA: cyclase family protein [Acidobacteriota bacterium]|nr:cyclase family protein [Acidobacteriota bacterium]
MNASPALKRTRRPAPQSGLLPPHLRFVDLSHTLVDGLSNGPGLPPVRVDDYTSHRESHHFLSEDTSLHRGRIEMVTHGATAIDVPFCRYQYGGDLSEVQLSRLADLSGELIEWPNRSQTRLEKTIQQRDLMDKAVLINSGWSRNWGQAGYFYCHPYFNPLVVEALRDSGAVLIGIDWPDVDDDRHWRRPASTQLMGEDIPVVKNLTGLSQLPRSGFRFFAAPVKIPDQGSFPVRAFAIRDRLY